MCEYERPTRTLVPSLSISRSTTPRALAWAFVLRVHRWKTVSVPSPDTSSFCMPPERSTRSPPTLRLARSMRIRLWKPSESFQVRDSEDSPRNRTWPPSIDPLVIVFREVVDTTPPFLAVRPWLLTSSADTVGARFTPATLLFRAIPARVVQAMTELAVAPEASAWLRSILVPYAWLSMPYVVVTSLAPASAGAVLEAGAADEAGAAATSAAMTLTAAPTLKNRVRVVMKTFCAMRIPAFGMGSPGTVTREWVVDRRRVAAVTITDRWVRRSFTGDRWGGANGRCPIHL
jgi:hypothetical protein